MGNYNSSFCKYSDQDIVSQVHLAKDQISRTTITSYHKSRSKNTNQSINKECIIWNKMTLNTNNTITSEETSKKILQITKNNSARKIVKFFRFIKIKNCWNKSHLLSRNKNESNKGKSSRSHMINANNFSLSSNKETLSYRSQGSKINHLTDYWSCFCTYLGEKSTIKQKSGFGILKCFNEQGKLSAEYIGTFKEDKVSGFGKMRFISLEGDIVLTHSYVGEFKNDKTSGFGVYAHTNKGTYTGWWKNDWLDDIGIESWIDNSYYQGEYKKGKKNGVGVYKWLDNSFYEGEWKDNNITGYGVYHYPDGKRLYIGEWNNNQKHGFGEYISTDKKYIGMYRNDKKHGFGIMYWFNLSRALICFWANGKQIGLGKYWSKDKVKYGIWSDCSNKTSWFNVKWIHKTEVTTAWTSWDSFYINIFSMTWEEVQEYFIKDDWEDIVQQSSSPTLICNI